jgi:hypothetical protein
VGAFARVWDLSIGPTPAYANGAMPLVATNTYAVAPQIWGNLGGYQDLVSALGGAHTTLGTGFGGGPFPIPLSGTFDASGSSPTYTPGNGIATWDGVTLTINVDGILKYNIQNSPKITDTRHLAGVLVYHPVVPEPSSLLMAGCGVVGLLSCAWRSRKHLPLAT